MNASLHQALPAASAETNARRGRASLPRAEKSAESFRAVLNPIDGETRGNVT
jgi:hypothetical protein